MKDLTKVKYCPILTKLLQEHQNQTYCLEEDCAWWLTNSKECAIVGIACMLKDEVVITRRVE